jgi:hypothetical protein
MSSGVKGKSFYKIVLNGQQQNGLIAPGVDRESCFEWHKFFTYQCALFQREWY